MAARNREFYIVHEDKDILVADKPAGLLAVPVPKGRAKNLEDLVADYLSSTKRCPTFTVHRIDRYTSGLMVFAKNEEAADELVRQFRNQEPERSYLAMVRGVIKEEEGELEHHLKLIRRGFRNIVVEPDEKGATYARLTYRVKERFLNTTLVEVKLDTGLKNQIRVQFEAFGHQLVGDQHYAPEEESEPLMNRQALHAWKLSLIHPRKKKRVSFEARIPADMMRLIDHYRWQMEREG